MSSPGVVSVVFVAPLLVGAGCSSDSAGDDDMMTASSESAGPSSSGESSSEEGSSSGDTTAASETGSATTGGPVDPPPTCGALENVPSEPGAHVAQIEGLADDEWLTLGPPAADPQFGGAMGRSWGGRALVLAPDLRGAFFTGEGVHAYVKPDGYAMDDVWFYDIHAHAWIAVYPGNNTETFNQRVIDGQLSIDQNGQLQDGNGNPVPLHVLIHAWDFLTFDPVSQRFAFLAGDGMGRYYMPGLEAIDEGLTMLEAQGEGIEAPPMSPWFYSTADCAFERSPVATATPDVGSYAAFMYASVSDEYVYAGSQGVAVYDRDSNDWNTVEDSGPRPTGYDHGAAYDSQRNRLYMGSGDGSSPGVYIYDIESATWTKPDSAGLAPASFRTNSASVFYDSVNDVVTVFHYGNGTHYTYTPDTDAWTSQPLPDNVLDAVSYASFSAFYDPVLNAYFVFAATDSMDNGTMWAYRWQSG